MKRIGNTKNDIAYLKAFGLHLKQLMKEKGYRSPYDFWINCAGDEMSRASLNYIVSGKSDPKLTTVRTIAVLLELKPEELLDFEHY